MFHFLKKILNCKILHCSYFLTTAFKENLYPSFLHSRIESLNKISGKKKSRFPYFYYHCLKLTGAIAIYLRNSFHGEQFM